jgi:hypothetical protein
MPRGDRTGPWGAGPLTGRGAGICAGYPTPGYANPAGGPCGWGRGWGGYGGRGFGARRLGAGGWGYRHWFYATGLPGWARGGYGPAFGPPPAPPTAEEESAYLENQAAWLRGELDALEARLADLRGGPAGPAAEEDRGG